MPEGCGFMSSDELAPEEHKQMSDVLKKEENALRGKLAQYNNAWKKYAKAKHNTTDRDAVFFSKDPEKDKKDLDDAAKELRRRARNTLLRRMRTMRNCNMP